MAPTRSSWRAEAEWVIAQTLAALPQGATEAQARAALRDAYPWSRRAGHAYKTWCAAARDALERRFGAEVPAGPEKPRIRLEVVLARRKRRLPLVPPVLMVDCSWCRHRSSRCLVCSPLCDRVALIGNDPEFRALCEGATDETGLSVLRDWLEEHGIATERGQPAPRKGAR